jgi:hypothetical protein
MTLGPKFKLHMAGNTMNNSIGKTRPKTTNLKFNGVIESAQHCSMSSTTIAGDIRPKVFLNKDPTSHLNHIRVHDIMTSHGTVWELLLV